MLTLLVGGCVLLMLALGQPLVFTASRLQDASRMGDAWHSVSVHISNGVIAFMALVIAASVPVERLKRLIPLLAIPSLFLYLLPFIPGFGVRSGGALREATIGPWRWEPGQLLAVTLVMWTAIIFSRRPLGRRRRLGALALVIAAILVALLQPDFSLVSLMLIPIALQALRAGVRGKRAVALSVAVGAIIMVAAMLHPYVSYRVGGWLDPAGTSRQAGRDYLLLQQGIEAGGLLGSGLGKGAYVVKTSSAKADYLLAHTVEELGAVAAFFILLLYVPILLAGLRVALMARDRFVALLGVGLAGYLLTGAAIHTAVNLRMIPVTAIHLPFLSFGGSALFSSALALGFLLSANRAVPFAGAILPEEETTPVALP
jgi:cell division protein FtsW (lipid II flippase)